MFYLVYQPYPSVNGQYGSVRKMTDKIICAKLHYEELFYVLLKVIISLSNFVSKRQSCFVLKQEKLYTPCNSFSSTQMIHELEGSNLMLLCFFVYFPGVSSKRKSLDHQTGCLDVACNDHYNFTSFVCCSLTQRNAQSI